MVSPDGVHWGGAAKATAVGWPADKQQGEERTVLKRSTIAATAVAVALAAVALISFAAPAGATPLPGENGRIALISYQNFGQTRAEVFLLPVPSSTGGGTLSPTIATSATERHRHPTWSPDRTKIAYARGVSAANTSDIFVQDLTQPVGAGN